MEFRVDRLLRAVHFPMMVLLGLTCESLEYLGVVDPTSNVNR
jgi:hypothetical protein